MKLLAPLKTPAKNTEQKIFKFVLVVVMPLMVALTLYSFDVINTKKHEFAGNEIAAQGGILNKRISMFLDPISRDIGYLQTLGNEKELRPSDPKAVQRTLYNFSKTHLQEVRQVVFWDKKEVSVYAVSPGYCEQIETTISPSHRAFLDETLEKANSSAIDWSEGLLETSVMAAMFFNAQKPCVVATDVNAAAFFEGLKNHENDRMFLMSKQQERLPRQFTFTDQGDPDIEVTNDPVILNVYTQWKSNKPGAAEKSNRMVLNGKAWWVSIRKLHIKNRDLYSGYILAEAEMLSGFYKGRQKFIAISLISFTIVLIATVFLWKRYQRDIEHSALPPMLNKMTNEQLLKAIAAGEDDQLEFKSTLRWNLHTNKPDKAMEIACLKTIAAFLNSDGGTLLVGVEDDGNIISIAADQFPNEDKFLLHFNNLINQHLGLETTDSFSFDIRHLESGDIMVVDCMPSPVPAYVTCDGKEEFYIRVGPGTRPLTTRDALEYIRNHF
jgi:hypothetical protein